MKFAATDGTKFDTREEYRAYEMETQYTFRDLTGETKTKLQNTIQGQPFDIADCSDCTLCLLDNSDMVQIDNVTSSKVFVAGSSESVFVRDCSNCVFTIACKQLRTRDCVNCTFYLYSKTEPIIETSRGMKFAPFNGAFEGHKAAMERANLQPSHNLWFAVFDFNDEAKTGKNWRIMEQKEEDPTWCPVGKHQNCCPRIKVGSIALPSQGADPNNLQSSGGMMSFGLGTSMHDAAKKTGDDYTAQETANAKHKSPSPKKAKSPPKKEQKKTNVGWNPGAFDEPTPPKKEQKKSGVGWNPGALEDPTPPKKEQKKSKVGWNPGALDEPKPAPATAPATAKSKPMIGWNPSALNDDTEVATRCDAPVITKKRTSSNETAGRSRTDSEISTGTTGEKGVTLELQALLLFAVERGVDLVKWFTPDDEAEKKMALVPNASGKQDILLTKEEFSSKITGLGLGLGAGMDKDTQEEIAAAISRGSIDTVARPRNCDAKSNHPKTGATRISLRLIFDVSKATNTLSSPPPAAPAAAAAPAVTAMAARRGVTSPAKTRPPPLPVSPANIKAAPALPLKQKPLWSPSAPNHVKHKQPAMVPLETPEVDLEKEIETCLKALARQADVYYKLRSKLKLESKCKSNESLKTREITKALGQLGLKLGPAGVAAMTRRITQTPPGQSSPDEIPATLLREYLLGLKLQKKQSRADWLKDKKQQDAIEQTNRQKEFQKALKGSYYVLPESYYDGMIESFEIISEDAAKGEVATSALEWLSSNEGIRSARRRAMAAEHGRGATVVDDEDKEIIFRQAKVEALEEKRKLLEEEEKAGQSTSKKLFRLFVLQNRRKNFQDTVSFADWCHKREDNRRAIREARKEWVESKDEEKKRRNAAGSKVAAIADVEELIKDLVTSASTQNTNKGGFSVMKPSRKGLEIGRKLREMQKASGDGKIVSKATFDKVMHDVIFSLMADKKTAKQAKALAKEYLGAEGSGSSGVFVEDESGKIAERALEIFSEKRSQAESTYKHWLKAKKSKEKKAKKEKRAQAKKKKAELVEKQKKAEDAYTNWLALNRSKKYYSFKRKEEAAIPKRVRKKQAQDWQEIIEEEEEDVTVAGDEENDGGGGN